MGERFANTCRNEDATYDPTYNVKTNSDDEQRSMVSQMSLLS